MSCKYYRMKEKPYYMSDETWSKIQDFQRRNKLDGLKEFLEKGDLKWATTSSSWIDSRYPNSRCFSFYNKIRRVEFKLPKINYRSQQAARRYQELVREQYEW